MQTQLPDQQNREEYLAGKALVCADNIDILKELPDNCIDLIYLDPPFNSGQNYNSIFGDKGRVEEQLRDVWRWTSETAVQYRNLPHGPVLNAIKGIRLITGDESKMTAYAMFMGRRLVQMRRVLKPTGSLYLHCNPYANYFLRILLDAVFGAERFRSEIIWRRTNAHNQTTKQYGPIHDTILFYSKTDKFTFHPGVRPYTKGYIKECFTHSDERGFYQTNYLTGPGLRQGKSGEPWGGFDPSSVERHWVIPRSLRSYLPSGSADMSSQEKLDSLNAQGLIVFPQKPSGQPMYKQYVGEGVLYQDLWAYQPNSSGILYGSDEHIDEDVKWLEDEPESIGYSTQKPLGLLSRIINTSSNPGNLVLDPFCGCGTAADAAAQLGRQYLGIDISAIAVRVMEQRLTSRGEHATPTVYMLDWSDYDWEQFEERALRGRDDAEDGVPGWAWAEDKVAGLLSAVPNDKKTGDGGVDARYYGADKEVIPIQVKMHRKPVGRPDMDKLLGSQTAMQNRGIHAPMSLMVSLYPPPHNLRTFAAEQGRVALNGEDYPMMQALSVKGMLTKGERPKLPPVDPRSLVGSTQTRMVIGG